MGNKRLKRVLRKFSFILLLIPVALQAQITAPGSNATSHTDYPVTPRRDSIYIFCGSSASAGTLVAASPGGTAPFTFTWTQYDKATSGYNTPVLTQTGTTSTATSLTEGGYRVHITDSYGYSTDLYAWVDLDSPIGTGKLKNSTCYYVALDGTFGLDKFYYYDPSTGVSSMLINTVNYLWESDPASIIPSITEDPVIYTPPLVNETYTFTVTDNFGCSTASSFYYVSYHVKANFIANPDEGEAPLEVTFTNTSVNANKYLWDFGDDSTSTLQDPPAHTYYIPGTYTVSLSVESEYFCSDTYTTTITVKPSALEMPNVFSPNGDGINDFLIPEKASLRHVDMQVFSKSGQRVYRFEGDSDAISTWTGWDGKVNNSNRFAEPGAYYYVIRAVGWDDKKYSGKPYRGVVYLFR
jgi:PKD repeat protein